MASGNKQRSPKKEARIDDASLNLLLVIIATLMLAVIILTAFVIITRVAQKNDKGNAPDNQQHTESTEEYPFRIEDIEINIPASSSAKNTISDELINSSAAILIDTTANEVVASRQGSQIIYPASMTKIMTLIVVAENLKSEEDLDDVITITREYNGNSGYGFKVGEKLTVEDLIYAAILQSDGVACLELAEYISGSEIDFVKLMNRKAEELGISTTTLFQNCTGLHHQYHYSTCHDIATIMAYAMKNPFCANVLSSIKYKPSDNFRPGDGCTFWHTLIHNHLSDGNVQPSHAEILGGKTGLTEKDTSGYCVVAFAKGDNGHDYITVTAKAESWVANIDDILNIYNEYVE